MEWSPLKHYPDLVEVEQTLNSHETKNKAGIYIWGFNDDNALFWPYYVGKHWDITFRLCQHLSSIKGGLYTIFRKEDLFSRLSRHDNRLYEPGNVQTWVDFIENGKVNIEPHIEFMISRFHFTYTLIKDFETVGNDAEKSVLNSIDKTVLVNTRFGKPTKPIEVGNLFQIIPEMWRSISQ